MKSCMLCSSPSIGTGEHVWSRWLLGDFAGEGPFRTEKSGVAYQKKNGGVATFTGLPGVHVPMCRPHNDILKRLVEDPAYPVMRRISGSDWEAWPKLTPDEARALGRWFLKVGLLLAHPDAEHDNPHVMRDADLDVCVDDYRPEWVSWMAAGDDPTDDFSVYISRRAVVDPQIDRVDPPGASGLTWETEVVLPEKLWIGSREVTFMWRTVGVRDLLATLVWHPGWPIVHPLVGSGRAAVIWPRPAAPVDLSALLPVGAQEFRFIPDGAVLRLSEADYASVTKTPLQVGLWPAGHVVETCAE
jgi:hypothetical protein